MLKYTLLLALAVTVFAGCNQTPAEDPNMIDSQTEEMGSTTIDSQLNEEIYVEEGMTEEEAVEGMESEPVTEEMMIEDDTVDTQN